MYIRSVSEITQYIKYLIDSDPILSDLWIRGEISNFQRAVSGHCYFTLKDDQSELRSVMWRSVAAQLTWLPSQGDLVNAHGYISVYERGGAYQFYIDTLEPAGEGWLWEEFQRLKARLEAEGLFSPQRKRPLPAWPKRIGVVTSPVGAAWQDIQRVIRGRYPLVELVLAPTQVQGSEAPQQIVEAIRRLNEEPGIDVIIVARGGGSLEDLWAFNDEAVARAVAASRVPVVSGVGHETDLTITDLAADVRAPTPSAAAAAVVPDAAELRRIVASHLETLYEIMMRQIESLRKNLEQLKRLLRLHDPRRLIAERRQRLDQTTMRLQRALEHLLDMRRTRLAGSIARLESLSPRQVISRGYAIVEHAKTGRPLQSVSEVEPQDLVHIHLRDGRVEAQVTTAHPGEIEG